MPFDSLPIETKPDVFSLESLYAWLCTMLPEREYCYYSLGGACLLGQYADTKGLPWNPRTISRLLSLAAPIAYMRPWTFGAARLRCEAAMRGEVVG